MANVESAIKRIRQTERRTARNKHVRTNVRSLVKKVRAAIIAGDKASATTALRTATASIDKAVSKGVIHKNAGSRSVARLATQVAAIGG